jgi:iron complex transport system ATP-binding protein
MIGFAGSVALAGRTVLHDVRFQAGAGELVAVVGPNGAGKSTLLRALAGLLPGGRPDPVRVAWLPQGARCAWGMTVAEVVALGRVPHGDAGAEAVEEAIAACGLSALRGERIDRLSGGQQRRAMLARVLAGASSVLLLDEPAADLDPAAAHEVMALLRARAEGGACVVAVLHDIGLALHHATRMAVVDGGRIVADGVPADVLPAAAAAFGLRFGLSDQPGLLPP